MLKAFSDAHQVLGWIAAGALLLVAVSPALAAPPETDAVQPPAANDRAVQYAIVIHGGAGQSAKNLGLQTSTAVTQSLDKALSIGLKILRSNGSSMDAVEQVIRYLEDDPRFNAGRGAVFNSEGGHELDASIMDGKTRNGGAVAGVTTVKHPISLARLVMTRTRHVSLAEAVGQAIHEKLEPGTGGMIAIGRDGTMVMDFNTPGMSRAAADSAGLHVIKIGR